MPYSDCCGAYTDMEEFGMCPDCHEHCDFYEEEEDDEEDYRAAMLQDEQRYEDSIKKNSEE